MAKERRMDVWLQCTSCKRNNYRTERPMQNLTTAEGRVDEQNRLKLKKFCPHERKHTVHRENRKK